MTESHVNSEAVTPMPPITAFWGKGGQKLPCCLLVCDRLGFSLYALGLQTAPEERREATPHDVLRSL